MTQVLLNHRTLTAAGGPLAHPTDSISNGGAKDLVLDSLRLLRCWLKRGVYRRDLTRLLAAGPHLLRDLGLDEADVREEIRKHFWQA